MEIIKIAEEYFMDKPVWHSLSETEAKELFMLLSKRRGENDV